MSFAMRHGTRPSRGTISPKPQPAGEARASLSADYPRWGAGLAGPASLPINPRPNGRRELRHAKETYPRINVHSSFLPCGVSSATVQNSPELHDGAHQNLL